MGFSITKAGHKKKNLLICISSDVSYPYIQPCSTSPKTSFWIYHISSYCCTCINSIHLLVVLPLERGRGQNDSKKWNVGYDSHTSLLRCLNGLAVF